MSSPVIECVELTKAYGKRIVALNNLTLTINEGASFGLLGENGAGKSTLVRLLMGFIFPTSGRVRVLGEEKMARAHPRIGYVHERPIFETRFKGRVYLTYLGELSGLWGYVNKARVDELRADERAGPAQPVGGTADHLRAAQTGQNRAAGELHYHLDADRRAFSAGGNAQGTDRFSGLAGRGALFQ